MADGGGAFAYLNLDDYLVMYNDNQNHYFINDLSISNKNKNITYLHINRNRPMNIQHRNMVISNIGPRYLREK